MAKVVWASENELEDYLYKYLSDHQHCPISDQEVEIVFRQFRIEPYGVIDLIGFSICPFGIGVHIYELKKEKVTVSSLAQVLRYKSGIKRLFQYKKIDENEVDITCCVVASEICMDDDTVYLYNELENVIIADIKYDMDKGIIFNSKEHTWHRTNDINHFASNSTSMDEIVSSFKKAVLAYQDVLAANKKQEELEG